MRYRGSGGAGPEAMPLQLSRWALRLWGSAKEQGNLAVGRGLRSGPCCAVGERSVQAQSQRGVAVGFGCGKGAAQGFLLTDKDDLVLAACDGGVEEVAAQYEGAGG